MAALDVTVKLYKDGALVSDNISSGSGESGGSGGNGEINNTTAVLGKAMLGKMLLGKT